MPLILVTPWALARPAKTPWLQFGVDIPIEVADAAEANHIATAILLGAPELQKIRWQWSTGKTDGTYDGNGHYIDRRQLDINESEAR